MTPSDITYGAQVEQGHWRAGRHGPSQAGYEALVDLIASWTAGSVQKVNTNLYSDAWPHPDFRNTPYSGAPEGILNAWPSMAWDSDNHRLILWGGGHQNTAANEVYLWDATTREWRLAFYPSEWAVRERSVDYNDSPPSAHTYYNNVWLPKLQRFFTVGGAAYDGGVPFSVWSEPEGLKLRGAGGFSLVLEREGLGWCAGRTGAHKHEGTSLNVNKPGAHAWQVHDWLGRASPPPNFRESHLNCGSAVREENGHDVVYFMGSIYNGVGRELWRCEFVNDNPDQDIVTQVARGDVEPAAGEGALAIDPVHNLLVSCPGVPEAGYRLLFVDLKTAAPRDWLFVNDAGFSSGPVATWKAQQEPNAGWAYDSRRGKFISLSRNSADFWEITTPAGNPTPTTGWVLEQVTVPSLPSVENDRVQGKFRYAPDLGCVVMIRNIYAGDVWLYKPPGWTDPRA